MVVFVIAVPAVAKLFNEDSQPTIVPIWPDNVKIVLFVPVQTATPPVTVPPTETGETVTVVAIELAVVQTPL